MGRRWTDEQLAVALNPSLTCTQAALQLHRTIVAVHAARMMYPNRRIHELGRSRPLEHRRYRHTRQPRLSAERATTPADLVLRARPSTVLSV
ncbi:hypothetical protein [Mycobacteroides abscessus]|uniref:hypothetical protein n=1 Tax=Mycobacteroides abscessus TaxID=36809 RepID=UPI000AD15AE5|nr:hypothetical protein [Mycobacteroides abscessus]